MKTILKEIITLRKFFVQDLPQGLGPERIMKIVDLSNLVDQHFKSLAANEKKYYTILVIKQPMILSRTQWRSSGLKKLNSPRYNPLVWVKLEI